MESIRFEAGGTRVVVLHEEPTFLCEQSTQTSMFGGLNRADLVRLTTTSPNRKCLLSTPVIYSNGDLIGSFRFWPDA